jgi:hypothetical protein
VGVCEEIELVPRERNGEFDGNDDDDDEFSRINQVFFLLIRKLFE